LVGGDNNYKWVIIGDCDIGIGMVFNLSNKGVEFVDLFMIIFD
jgi:hypothetical protein